MKPCPFDRAKLLPAECRHTASIVKTLTVLTWLLSLAAVTAQTSWKGTTSTDWSVAANWTAGVPGSSVDAIIGDASFTGSFQPALAANSACKSLTLGTGTKASTLTVGRALNVAGYINIGTNGTLDHTANRTISISGNWTNGGTYTAGANKATVTFTGASQRLSGLTTFQKLTINASSTTMLDANISVLNQLTVSGILDPTEPTTRTLAGNGKLVLNSGGRLLVKAATFAGNYGMSGLITISAGSTVDYAATNVNQTVDSTLTYDTLRVSGSGTKSLAANLPALNSSSAAAGVLNVAAGTLDLAGFTANRGTTVAGGTCRVQNGATLKIKGTATIPANYATRLFDLTSTVEYGGTAQTVSLETYGNLTLSSSSGSVVKTMPASAMSISGNLTTSMGTGTAVAFTAGAAITVAGHVTLGTGTTFSGGAFAHSVGGNWTNQGTFTGGTSTVTMNGPDTVLAGTGVHNFFNLTIGRSGITALTSTDLSVAGNFTTTGAGTFTHTPGGTGTVTLSGTSKTISGTGITFNNLTLSGSISSAASFSVAGNLSVSGSWSASAGTITLSGTGKTISGAGPIAFFALNVPGSITTASSFSLASDFSVAGSFTATAGMTTFTSSTTLSGTASLFNSTLNGTLLRMGPGSTLRLAGTTTLTAGTFDTTNQVPNTIVYNSTGDQIVYPITYNLLEIGAGGTKTSVGNILASTITINAGAVFNGGAGSYTNYVQEDWRNNGTFAAGNGAVEFNGARDGTISGSNSFNRVRVNKNVASLLVQLNTNQTVATLDMVLGTLNTGTNTLTLTTTRTGNGSVFGTITRLHSFSAGTAYAFESPSNTVTFASLGTVSSVTVTVAAAPVADFPFGSAVNRLYTLSLAASGAYNATLRLHYEDSELAGLDESGLQLYRYTSSWTAAGQTARDAANNWVEQSGLTDLTGRWTLSQSNPNIVRWNGSVSTAWETAANWTIVSGAPSRPPASTDIVALGDAAFAAQPTITSAATVKGLSFGSVQAVTLTLGAGSSLTTSGNVSGVWSANASHTIDVGSRALSVGGSLALSDGTNGHAIHLSVGTGSVTVTGALMETGDANITFSGAGNLAVAGDFLHSGGTFTPGAGTVTYNGSAAQRVAAVTYNHLKFTKSAGLATLAAAATANGHLLLTNGGTFRVNASLTVAGDVTIQTNATLDPGASSLYVGGNWVSPGTFIPNASQVIFNGTGAQSIGACNFNGFNVNKTAGVATLAGNLVINTDVDVYSGTLDMSTFSIARGAAGAVLFLGAGTTLRTAAAFPANFAARTLDATSTVEYYGAGTQSVSAETYGHLVLTNGASNAKTLAGPTIVAGNLFLGSNATLAADTNSLTLQGHWTNNGTFSSGTGTVVLSGASKSVAGATTFNHLTVPGSYTVANSDIRVNGNFTVSGTYAAGTGTHTLDGDLSNSGSLSSSGTTSFSGTRTQTLRILNALQSVSTGVINFNGTVTPVFNSTTPPQFANINLNNTGGITPSIGWTVFGAFNVASGVTFTGGALTHTFYGNWTNQGTVTSSATLDFRPVSAKTLVLSGTSFNSSGHVIFGGSGQLTLVGGAAAFNDVSFVNSHSAGVTPAGNWTLSGNLSINAGSTFHGGTGLSHTVAGNFTDFGTFNGGTSTVILSGVADINGSGLTTFYHLTIGGTNTALTDFNVAGTFTHNGTFDGSGVTVTFSGGSAGSIAGSVTPVPLDFMAVAKSAATVTLAANLSGLTSLNISGGTLEAGSFTIVTNGSAGTLSVGAGATLKIGGANTLPTFGANSFDPAGTVEYNGASGQAIAARNYGNLTSSSSGARTLPASATVGIAGTFTPGGNSYTITSSTVDFNGAGSQTVAAFNYNHLTSSSTGARTLAASGTIGVAGTFTPGANSFTVSGSTMNFNGAAQTVPAFTYGNLTTSGSGTKTLGGNVTVGGNLNLSAGTLADGGFIATVNGDVANSVTHSGAGKILLSGGTTNHLLSGGGTFSTLELNDTNGALLSATNLTVTNLTLTAGAITTSTNRVIIPTGGIVARTNGFVAGWLQKPLATGAPTVTFEVGGLTNYAPVTLLFSNVTVAGAVLARTVGTDHPEIANAPINPTKSANRYWTVTNVSGTFSSYRPTLNFTAGDLDALANPTNFLVGKLTSAVWTAPAIVTRTATNIQTASLTTFGDFQVGEVANVAPVAAGDVVSRAGGTSGFKVSPTDLLANDTDANGDPLTLISVTNRSVQGAAVELFGSWIFYTPTNAINVNDSFTYTISDGQGGTAVGTVSVNIVSPTQARQLTSVAAGSGSFYGVLNTAYAVQYVDDMASTNWLTLTNITSSASGLGQFTDPGPLPSQRFYRIAYP